MCMISRCQVLAPLVFAAIREISRPPVPPERGPV